MIPASVLVEHLFPFLDRTTFEACQVLNREVYQECKKVLGCPPWPCRASLDLQTEIFSVAISKHWIACGCQNGDVVLVSRQNGHKISLVGGHRGAVTALAFPQSSNDFPSSSSLLLASGSVDRTIRLWHIPSSSSASSPNFLPKQPIPSEVLLGHARAIHSLTFVPGSSLLLSAAQEPMIRVWNVHTHKCAGKIPASALDAGDPLGSMALSPGGKILATATWNGTIRLWELCDTAYRPIQMTLEPGLPLTQLQFDQTGNILYGLKGFRIRCWDLEKNGQMSFRIGSGVHTVASVALTPNGRTVVYGDKNGTLRVSRLGKDLKEAQFLETLYGHHHQCCMAFSPDGKTSVSGGEDGSLRIWSVPTQPQ